MNSRESTCDPAALIDMLLALEGLDRIPRTGYLQRGVSAPESVAEHSFHVATLAWALLPAVQVTAEQPLDPVRVLELALFHDSGERLLGDLPRPAHRLFPPGVKAAAERSALEELLSATEDRGARIAQDVGDASSPEWQFVHACDRLQLLLKTALYSSWNEGSCADFFDQLARASQNEPTGFPAVDAIRDALIARMRGTESPTG